MSSGEAARTPYSFLPAFCIQLGGWRRNTSPPRRAPHHSPSPPTCLSGAWEWTVKVVAGLRCCAALLPAGRRKKVHDEKHGRWRPLLWGRIVPVPEPTVPSGVDAGSIKSTWKLTLDPTTLVSQSSPPSTSPLILPARLRLLLPRTLAYGLLARLSRLLSSGLTLSNCSRRASRALPRVDQAVRINNGFVCHLPPAISHLICHQPWTPGPGKAILSSSRRPLGGWKRLGVLAGAPVPVAARSPGPRPPSIVHPPSTHRHTSLPASLSSRTLFSSWLFLYPCQSLPRPSMSPPQALMRRRPPPPSSTLVGLHHPPPSPAPSHQHGL